MKLRITTGQTDGLAELPVLCKHGSLLIEGDASVRPIKVPGAAVAFLAGDPVTRHGTDPEVGSDLQGRYLVVTVVDGECAVRADRFGQVDVYVEQADGRAIAATSLDLLPMARNGAALDQAALAHTLCVYGTRPPKRHTLYRTVRRLGVGEELRVANGRASMSERRFSPMETADYSDADLSRYSDTLLEAVRSRASEHGNIVYLSSGWDSTSLLACLVHLFGPSRVRAIIGRMRYADRSGVINQFEIDRAQAVATFFGVPLEIAEFDYRTGGPAMLARVAPLFKAHQIASLVGLNHAILAEAAARTAQGGEAVFAGEVSDGAHNLGFSQFVTIFHPVQDFREYSDKMASYLFGPTFLSLLRDGRYADDPVYGLLRGRSGGAEFDAPSDGGSARTRQLLASFFLRSHRLPLWSLRNTRFLTPDGRERYSTEMEQTYLSAAGAEAEPSTLYSWYLRLYNSFHWQGSTVVTLPLTAEAHGLRPALPFWDAAVQDFLSAMPEHWGRGLDFNRTKYPLKWMLQNRIRYPYHLQAGPHSYIYDVDPRFSHAAELLFASSFAPFFKATLQRRAYRDALSADWFDLSYVDGMVDRYVNGTEASGPELTDLTSLCLLSMIGWYGGLTAA